ncbi:hypothetical protein MMC07_000711 [Pseudocyphellaria aurata]|nr:hypothetical protein [Pseudocyphellaria aurata]
MASPVEISIPNASISNTSKPYTLYNITLRLPLRSFTVQKRYSDFTTLHTTLTNQAGAPPPAILPGKSWFTKTTSSPEFTEERRKGLETYLQTLNQTEDQRWRNTSAWRSFLNLPSNSSSKSSLASGLHSAIAGSGSGAPITDPVVWLDQYRELKSQLHDARLHVTKRDQATTAQSQHEAGAQAKKCLVRAGTTMAALEQGLKNLGTDAWGSARLGQGELLRRKDLIGSAKREKEGLESLLSAMITKSHVDKTVAAAQEKQQLVGSASGNGKASGRVLGRETDRTRALGNQGVLQLQKQMMEEQDEDVMVLAKAVARQKELGVAIHEELLVQNEMLGMLDEDVTRVQGKIDIAKKRISKIS